MLRDARCQCTHFKLPSIFHWTFWAAHQRAQRHALDSSCSHASPGQPRQAKPDQTMARQASQCQTSLGQASPVAHSQSRSDQARLESTPGRPGPDKDTPAAKARPDQAAGYAFEYGPGRHSWKYFRDGAKKFLRAMLGRRC